MSTLHPIEPRAERRTDGRQLREQPRQIDSPYLLSIEAADYLRYRGRHKLRSLYRFLAKHGIRTSRRNHTLLILKRDLDLAIGAGRKR